jgi:hypothetical protein
VDWFRESVDSFRIVVTNPDSKKIRFVSCHESWLHRFANPDSQIRSLKIQIVDSFRDLNFQRFDLFSRIQRILTNPYESLVLYHETNPYESNSRIQTLKIRFVDSFRRHVFERFVSWIRFVGLFSKDSFRGFVSWKQKSQITRFVSIRKDSYTNPASLQFSNQVVSSSAAIGHRMSQG